MQITLSTEERDFLFNLLKTQLDLLRGEIYHTDEYEFKQILKHERAVIDQLLQRLENPYELVEAHKEG